MGAEADNSLLRGIKKCAGDLEDGRTVDRIDKGQQLLNGAVRLAVQRCSSRPIHARRHTLHREHQLAAQLSLASRQLGLWQPFLHNLHQHLPHGVECVLGRLRGTGEVHAMDAGVGVRRTERVHAIGKTQLLTDALKEPRTHPATQQHVKKRKCVPTRVAVGQRRAAEYHVRLRNVLATHMMRLRRGGDRDGHRERTHVAHNAIAPPGRE